MVPCLRIRERLPEWLRGRCNEAEGDRIARHVQSCARCHAAAAEETELARGFAALSRPEPRASVWPRLEARLALPESPPLSAPGSTRRRAGTALAGGAALVLAIAGWLTVRETPAPRPSIPAGPVLARREVIALGRVLVPPRPAAVDDPLRRDAEAWLVTLREAVEER